MEEFTQKLKKKREELGLTLKEVAWQLGVTQDAIARIEVGDFSGVELYVKSLLMRYCEFLGVDTAEGLKAYQKWKEAAVSAEAQDEEQVQEERRYLGLEMHDVIVLTMLYSVAVILAIANWMVLSSMNEFKRYTVFSVTNTAAAPVVIEVERDGALVERQKLLAGEVIEYRIGPKMAFNFVTPGGNVELSLGRKVWKVNLNRFRVEVEDGNAKSP